MDVVKVDEPGARGEELPSYWSGEAARVGALGGTVLGKHEGVADRLP